METLYKSDTLQIVRDAAKTMIWMVPAIDPIGGKYWTQIATAGHGSAIYTCYCEVLKVKP